jgi:cell shape-determining protein MreC
VEVLVDFYLLIRVQSLQKVLYTADDKQLNQELTDKTSLSNALEKNIESKTKEIELEKDESKKKILEDNLKSYKDALETNKKSIDLINSEITSRKNTPMR